MERIKDAWYAIPSPIRKPIVFTVGGCLVLISPFLGWLPGPGGVPLFLLGIAILSTEFVWAERFRNKILTWLEPVFDWFREHKVLGTFLLALAITLGLGITYHSIRYYI